MFGMGPKTEVTASLTIKDFPRVMEASKPGQHYETDDFMVKETPMRLGVFPNGAKEEERGKLAVYVQNRSQVEVKVKKQYFLARKISDMTEYTLKPRRRRNGVSINLSHDIKEEIKEHYKEKDFVVKVKVEMEGEVVKIREGEEAQRKRKLISQEVTETAYRKMAWTDFTLVFEGEDVACHKVILAGASTVFAAMLENDHQEAREGRAIIQLPAAVGRAFVR